MRNERIWELMARKMSGEASSEELEELDQALKINPHLHFSVQAFSDLWKHSSQKSLSESKQAYQRHLAKLQNKGISVGLPDHQPEFEQVLLEGSRRNKRFRLAAILSLAVLLIAASAWYLSTNKKTSVVANEPVKETTNEVSTKYGSKTRIQLPDGSQVWLNAGSKLNYNKDFGQELREVQLIGEGFFDVKKNAQKPFIIHTKAVDIKVLGTQFNVKSYPGDKTTETSLVHGSVEIVVRKRPDEKFILKPNEKIVVLNEVEDSVVGTPTKLHKPRKEPLIAISKLTYKLGDSIAVETAWTFNKLSFEDETFDEVAKKMARWYDVEFEFRNSKLEDIRLKGSFINETLVQAMDALQFANSFKYEVSGKKVIIY